jgi:dimethylargininase
MNYRNAIIRRPGKNFADGLTSSSLGEPDIDLAIQQHANYQKALEGCGLQVTVLPALEDFPDCPFVEDTAILTEVCSIITNPGDLSRQGEAHKIIDQLSSFKNLEHIKSPGTVDGGDIMRIDNHFYIGLSKRTNQEGALQLSNIFSKYGFTSSTVPVSTVLHLKTGVTYIGNNNLVAIDEFAINPIFKDFNIIKTDPDENYAANCLLINGKLLIPQGFPKLLSKLETLGYQTLPVEMSEFAKMDGGLTCLSLLY